MNSVIDTLNKLYDAGILSNASLSMSIILVLLLGYKYLLYPMYKKVMKLPTSDDIKTITKENAVAEKEAIAELMKKINIVYEHLEKIEDFDKDSSRDIKELYNVVKEIKTVLTQFQGHMLYSQGRRTEDFGNRELK